LIKAVVPLTELIDGFARALFSTIGHTIEDQFEEYEKSLPSRLGSGQVPRGEF
jgi:hypothetical protein